MSQFMGLCLKELALLSVLPTGESVSVLPTRIRTSSPRQNGIGSEENRYLYLRGPGHEPLFMVP